MFMSWIVFARMAFIFDELNRKAGSKPEVVGRADTCFALPYRATGSGQGKFFCPGDFVIKVKSQMSYCPDL
jgi:hypothetical protein